MGQNLPSFPTPNTAAFNIFLQYPQSSFTGVPNINVPVCKFISQGLDLSIGLSYNTNLVKPRNFGSWVGLGWSLSAEGSISRVVNGKPDEMKWVDQSSYILFQEEQVGYRYNHGYLSGSDWINGDKVTSAILDVRKNYDYQPSPDQDYAFTVKDYAPDEFSFSIGDLSGKFYMDDQGGWKVKSNTKVDILINEEDYGIYTTPSTSFNGKQVNFPNNYFINKITLIDHRGIRYYFGGISTANEKDNNYLNQYSTWHISEIRFPNGKSIKYEYEKGQYVSCDMPESYNSPIYENHIVYFRTVRYDPAYLKRIITDDEQIDFFRSENAGEFAKLDSLKHRNNIGKLIKTVAFSYINRPMDRLKLANVYFKDNQNSVKERYQFIYDPLTFTNNVNTDHWGFFTTKQIAVPNLATSRIPDTAVCRAELLHQIIYPTGGSSVYTWEPNDCSKVVTSDRTKLDIYNYNSSTGGVRIKQISFLDKDGKLADYKKYCYNRDYGLPNYASLSSGIRYSYPRYDGGPYRIYLSPGLPLQDNNVGSHVSYTEVTEINSNGSYTVTDFSNFDSGVSNEYMDEVPLAFKSEGSAPRYFTSHSHERGFPLEMRIYSSDNIIVSKREIQYTRVNPETRYVRAYMGGLLDGVWFHPDGTYKIFFNWSGSAVKFFLNPYLQTKVKEVTYVNGASGQELVSQTFYDEKTLNVSSQEIVNSKGEVLKTTNDYANNIVDQGKDYSGIYTKMLNNNVLDLPVDIVKKVNGIQTELRHTDYTEPMPGLFKPLAESVQYKSEVPQKIISYEGYDGRNGNLINFSKNSGVKFAYQWGYNESLPIVSSINAQNDVKTYTPETQAGFLPLSQNNGRGSITFTTYYKGNVRLAIRLTGAPSKPFTFALSLSSERYLTNINLCFGFNDPTYCGPASKDYIELGNLEPGTYTLSIIGVFYPGDFTTIQAGIDYSFQGRKTVTTGMKEFFYDGFEESPMVPAFAGHTGAKYTVNTLVNWVRPNLRQYVISYWYKVNNIWKYSGENDYTKDSYTLIGSDVNAYDDVRIQPKDAQLTTYTYEPQIGITSITNDNGQTTFFEYDAFQRLSLIRDNRRNIAKQVLYNNLTEEANSSIAPNWQNTSTAIRCKTNSSAQNTGEQEQEQKNVNAASLTYNQTRWVVVATNTVACPLPIVNNCTDCYREYQKCINGVCEIGVQVYLSSTQNPSTGLWTCEYRYEFSDGSWSQNYMATSPGACTFSNTF
ncbi:hypothetical protein [Mucilaginibacter lacusdianchii]|uniref:hypothetical protein n=1 Tax=Mucilaginibacter lacusdianchii TaxID=2684211 RepID=UPI00131C7C0E|nr:hypothetical protein [Mucilaginibacter sp. JXJ CY 39]